MESVKIGEEELEVDGRYQMGQREDRDSPPISDSFEIYDVFYNGVNISDLINEIDSSFYQKIELTILENYK